jgi:Protein of unknown function (DUF3102)
MPTTQAETKLPAPASAPPELLGREPSTLAELGPRIRSAHEHLVNSARDIVMRAIDIGKDLLKAQSIGGYGNWGKWLERNCALNERTAQRYMEIAKGETTLRAKVTSDTMSELTLKKAKQLITAGEAGAGTNSGTGTSPRTSDTYDAVEGKLIKKLEEIVSPDTAIAAAQETINKLVDRVRIETGGKHALKLP